MLGQWDMDTALSRVELQSRAERPYITIIVTCFALSFSIIKQITYGGFEGFIDEI